MIETLSVAPAVAAAPSTTESFSMISPSSLTSSIDLAGGSFIEAERASVFSSPTFESFNPPSIGIDLRGGTTEPTPGVTLFSYDKGSTTSEVLPTPQEAVVAVEAFLDQEYQSSLPELPEPGEMVSAVEAFLDHQYQMLVQEEKVTEDSISVAVETQGESLTTGLNEQQETSTSFAVETPSLFEQEITIDREYAAKEVVPALREISYAEPEKTVEQILQDKQERLELTTVETEAQLLTQPKLVEQSETTSAVQSTPQTSNVIGSRGAVLPPADEDQLEKRWVVDERAQTARLTGFRTAFSEASGSEKTTLTDKVMDCFVETEEQKSEPLQPGQTDYSLKKVEDDALASGGEFTAQDFNMIITNIVEETPAVKKDYQGRAVSEEDVELVFHGVLLYLALLDQENSS